MLEPAAVQMKATAEYKQDCLLPGATTAVFCPAKSGRRSRADQFYCSARQETSERAEGRNRFRQSRRREREGITTNVGVFPSEEEEDFHEFLPEQSRKYSECRLIGIVLWEQCLSVSVTVLRVEEILLCNCL